MQRLLSLNITKAVTSDATESWHIAIEVGKNKNKVIRFFGMRNLIYLFFLTLVTHDKHPTKAAQSETSKKLMR